MRKALFPFVCLLLLAVAQAQVSAPQPDQTTPRPAAHTAVPSEAPSGSVLQLQQAAENLRVDLARLRIDKWKADKNSKQQAQDNAHSLDRNLQLALPGIMQQAQASPASLAAQFKLYRNVSALYDVLSGLTESAGAFGPHEEYSALQNDVSAFDQLRHQMGDQLESLAVQKDSELNRLTAQARAAAEPATPPKKVVIDDTAPGKTASKSKKKKAAAKQQPQQ